jgi:acetyl esterase/lipase
MTNAARVKGWAVLALLAAIAGSAMADPAPDPLPSTMDAQGIEHVPAFTWPLSDLTSPAFHDAYRHVVDSPFPLPPANDAPPAEWNRYRADEDRRAADILTKVRARNAVDISETQIAGVSAAIVTPRAGVSRDNRHRVLLYLHGGGFFMSRDIEAAVSGAIAISALGRIRVIALAYREFPEVRYPAASQDVADVYGALLKRYKASSIGLYGCSAGGVLVGQSVAWFQAHRLPRPGAVALLCAAPMVPGKAAYMWAAGDSRFWGANGNFLGPWPANETADGYFEGARPDDPTAYPGISEHVLAQFPPTLLVSGTRAVEMSPVIVAHAKFLRLGVKSSLYLMEGGWHAAPLGAQGTPEGDAALSYIARWFTENLAR